MSVRYKKLRSGDWGLSSDVELKPGSLVRVTKTDGSIVNERVGELVASKASWWLYAIAERKRTTCRECHGPLVDAKHHMAMEGYCGSCAFDEFDC